MPKKDLPPMPNHATVRLTDQEMLKLRQYCKKNHISQSEYLRRLLRIHLGLEDSFLKVYEADRPKKENP